MFVYRAALVAAKLQNDNDDDDARRSGREDRTCYLDTNVLYAYCLRSDEPTPTVTVDLEY